MKSIKFLNCLKVLCAAILLVCLSGFAMSAQATEIVDSGTCGENLTWTLDIEGVLTISGTGAMTDYSWSNRSPWDNNADLIQKVVITDGITTIGKWAFPACINLTEVTISDSVTAIGDEAFRDCDSLTAVNIGSNVTQIGDMAFMDCSNLIQINVDLNNPNYSSSSGILFNKEKSLLIQAPGSISGAYAIPDSVTSVGDYAFYNCDNLTAVTIPDNVVTIGNSAFYDCDGLSVIIIPDNITLLGEYAFFDCENITTVTIGNGVSTIGTYAFAHCTNMSAATIGNSVTTVEAYSFFDCSSLTTIAFPDSVTLIDSFAFYDCYSLTTAKLSNSLSTIGDYAFCNCTSLTEITFTGDAPVFGQYGGYGIFHNVTATAYYPADNATWTEDKLQDYNGEITWIGVIASGTCGDNLTWTLDKNGTLTISGTGPMSYTSSPWSGNDSIKKIIIENGVTTIGYEAFAYCPGITSITIPDSVTSIESWAFTSCKSLTSVAIGSGVTSIGRLAFSDCNKLTEIQVDADNLNYSSDAYGVLFDKDKTALIKAPAELSGSYSIPDSVTTIAEAAFADCKLSSVNIPDSVTNIEMHAFLRCKNLTSIIIPYGVEDIGEGTFGHCTALTAATIPNSVKSIGYEAFYGCDSLPSVNIPQSVESIEDMAFAHCDNLAKIIVDDHNLHYTDDNGILFNKDKTRLCQAPGGLTGAYTIPTGVSGISYYAFNGCSGVTAVTIPDSVTTVGDWAFAGCSKLTKITFTGDAPFIGYMGVFKNVTATAYYPADNDTWKEDKLKDYDGTITWVSYERLKITTQPTTKTVKEGTTAKFSVTATGNGLKYQWQYRTSSSGSWKNANATGNTTATLSVPASVSRSGYQYRCVVTDSNGNKINSKAVYLYVLGIKTQPVTQKVKDGTTAKFTVSATGAGKTYQWQYRTSSSGSWKNAKATGNTTKTLSVPASVSRHGYQYRCRITDSTGNKVYTKTVSLYVLGIKTQPVSKTVVDGKTAKFTVTATGTGLSYQWQYRTSSSGSWKNASATGNKTKTLSVPATVSRHGYQYRCKITDSAGNTVTTKVVNLYVLGIKTQPASKTVKVGATAKFTVTATGRGLTYQWQYKTSSIGSWKNVSAASGKTANYSLTAKSRHNGYQYRCRITDSAGNVIYSNTVKLTVK